jgi:hypothetical protein
MPADDRLGLHNRQNIRPLWPQFAQNGPEEAIEVVQCWSPAFAFEHSDLLTQCEDFQVKYPRGCGKKHGRRPRMPK